MRNQSAGIPALFSLFRDLLTAKKYTVISFLHTL